MSELEPDFLWADEDFTEAQRKADETKQSEEREKEITRRLKVSHLPESSINSPEITIFNKRPWKAHNSKFAVRQLAEAKARMSMLYADDVTLKEIARIITEEFALEEPISYKAVEYHLANITSYWKKQTLKSITERQAVVLARYDQIEQLAVNAYFASMEGKKTVKLEKEINELKAGKSKAKTIRDAIKVEMAKLESKGQTFDPDKNMDFLEKVLISTAEKMKQFEALEANKAGNPKFLEIMFKINQERCRIWGLYARPEDTLSPDQEAAQLSDGERMQKLGALIQAVARRQSGNLENTENASNSHISRLAKPAPLGFTEDEVPEDEEENV